jgi:hypothetical protein
MLRKVTWAQLGYQATPESIAKAEAALGEGSVNQKPC